MDIFRVSDLRWSCLDDLHERVLGKVDYIENTPKGLKIHLKKEKKIPMVKWEKGEVIYAVEAENYVDEYTITDIDYYQCFPDPKAFKVEILRKPKRKPYNGKIFILCDSECHVLRSNVIYTVKNGAIINRIGDRVPACPAEPYIFEGMCEDELSDAIDLYVFYGKTYSGTKDPRRHYTAYFVKE